MWYYSLPLTSYSLFRFERFLCNPAGLGRWLCPSSLWSLWQTIVPCCIGHCKFSVRQQMLESTERCVALSEPNSPEIITYNYQKFGDSPKLRELARDVVRWECRPYPTMQPPPLAYVLKFRDQCIAALPLLRWCHILIVERCNECVCVHVYVCLCVLTRISGTARLKITK